MTSHGKNAEHMNRRRFVEWMGAGVYSAALTSVLGQPLFGETKADSNPLRKSLHNLKPKAPPRPATAKSVIQLFMNGGPSQMDLFDPKPELTKREGQSYFQDIAGEVENPAEAGALMGSPFRFRQHGQSGMWVSDVMPHFAKCVDDVTMIRSMHTVNITHEPAIYKIQSGGMLPGLPTMGAWVSYGLGTENQDLPAYVVLEDPKGLPINGTQNWQCGFLPPIFQGTRFRSNGAPVNVGGNRLLGSCFAPSSCLPGRIAVVVSQFYAGEDSGCRYSHPGETGSPHESWGGTRTRAGRRSTSLSSRGRWRKSPASRGSI